MIDTHAHLMYAHRGGYPGGPQAVVERAIAAGLRHLICVGAGGDLAEVQSALQAARQFAGVSAICGIHPHDAKRLADGDGSDLWAGVEAACADPSCVAVGETGLVRYRGPGCARDFLDENGQAAASDAAGWFLPGDLGTCDADGYLRLVGRAKDMILRAGVNVYPAEVERVLREHAAVADVGVVGEPSASHGEQVVAFVVLQSTAGDAGTGVGNGVGDDSLACIAEQLLAHCRERLAPYKVPARMVFLPALPKAGMGKTDKKALRALL